MKTMFIAFAASLLLMAAPVNAQPKLTLQVDKAQRTVSPTLYGLMTEEINYSYEGGLYSQLLRDIAMQEMTGGQQGRRQQGGGRQGGPAPKPRYWILNDSTAGTLRFNTTGGISFVQKRSLSIEATETTIKIPFQPTDTIFDVYHKMNEKIEEIKADNGNNNTEDVAEVLCKAPRFLLRFAIWILKVLDWIPHMKKLGINAIYFSPVFESDTHGYNTRDYGLIDTRLGTNDDFKKVVKALHKEGPLFLSAEYMPWLL